MKNFLTARQEEQAPDRPARRHRSTRHQKKQAKRHTRSPLPKRNSTDSQEQEANSQDHLFQRETARTAKSRQTTPEAELHQKGQSEQTKLQEH